MKLSLGISDYKKIIDGGYYYVDKTLLIEELDHTSGLVLLIPRPRRFGKTLNLSMLRYFFEKSHTNTQYLFENTLIWQNPKYQAMQGLYPVIFLSFKNAKVGSWEKSYARIQTEIIEEFERHSYVLEAFSERAKTGNPEAIRIKSDYEAILTRQATLEQYERSLLFLTQVLYQYHNKDVIVLIDEYDVPINDGYSRGYYTEIVDFIRSLLTTVLKDNKYLHRGILTGVLRLAKESIFSGLNNPIVSTLLDSEFSDKFGFTAEEVDHMLIDARLEKLNFTIKEWYNGYAFGKTTIYNPWSVLECIHKKGQVGPYWANTSDNFLIKKLITCSEKLIKSDLELLVQGHSVIHEVDGGLSYPEIRTNPKALWSLLLFTGYVTATHVDIREGRTFCTLALPNKEIKLLYNQLITTIFEEVLSLEKIHTLKEALFTGNGILFSELVQDFISKSMSFFDMPSDEPERSYHLFILGLLVTFSDSYEVKSNRESGHGRYDIILIPRDSSLWAIILEFKKVSSDETMQEAAQKALKQIIDKDYIQELHVRSMKRVVAFGIACQGKKIETITHIFP
ncbi:AAA family ATPase [Candidatus Dependentiae bacterium]|nr:AAA family ATPase [Candidatus Dependentiae bacterium]